MFNRRNRLTEDSQILSWDAADVTPEAGQTTKITVMDLDRNILAVHTGITGTSFDIPLSSFYDGGSPSALVSNAIVRVTSERDGLESLQGHEISVVVSVLMISGTPVLTATLGEAYTGFTVSASGGTPPYTYSLVGDWPDGISVNPSTGAVSGTPTEMGSFTGLSVRVTDDIGNTADLPSFTLGVSTAGNVVAYANFQLPSATGNFSISTTDLGGRTPKMAIFCLSNAEVSETGHSVINEDGFHTFGATDGTNQWAATSCVANGSNNDQRGYTASACLAMVNNAATPLLAASFVSFGADQVTINITTLNSQLYLKRGFVIFFAGDNCQAEVGVINGEVDGAATKTIGFTPEGMLFSESNVAAPDSYAATAIQTFGFAINDGSATQYNCGRFRGTGGGVARANNKAAGYGDSSIPTCTVSFSGANVTATQSTATELDLPYAAWSFGGALTAKAGTLTSPTSAGTVTASGLGITPTSALFLTGPAALNTTVAGGFGAGWLTGSAGGSMGCTSATGYCSTTRLNIANGADLASLSSFASGQMTLNFTTADATARLIPFIAFGS